MEQKGTNPMKRFHNKMTFRLFEREYQMLQKLVLHKHTEDGFRKYESPSHFVRCKIIEGIRRELPTIQVKRGRPRKYG